MARSVAWRRQVTDAVSWRQDQALGTTIYILRQTGPTGFLLKEDGEQKNFKVLLGDPHRCTCPVYLKERDLCKHICWVLLKKFKVARQNAVTWQLGLVEREINEILRGPPSDPRPPARGRPPANTGGPPGREGGPQGGTVPQKDISSEDVCPICQDELLDARQPVTYCKFGCGNNVHIKCMKVWAEHQTKSGKTAIECPFCREDFGSLSLLRVEMKNSGQREERAERLSEHLGTTCRRCHVCPVSGKCYRCRTCPDYHLCQACFNTPTHAHHQFDFRQKPSQRWRPVAARSEGGGALPDAVVSSLLTREIGDDDYDLLLQLDQTSGGAAETSDLSEETLRLFPVERIRASGPLLAPGQQCRVCLRGYEEGQYVRSLPCRHKFHKTCIDEWLLHRRPSCPVDGTTYTNEGVRAMNLANRNRDRQRRQASQNDTETNGRNHSNRQPGVSPSDGMSLMIPGVGVARDGGQRSSGRRHGNPHTRTPSGGRRHRLQDASRAMSLGDLVTTGNNLQIHANGGHGNQLQGGQLEDMLINMVANDNRMVANDNRLAANDNRMEADDWRADNQWVDHDLVTSPNHRQPSAHSALSPQSALSPVFLDDSSRPSVQTVTFDPGAVTFDPAPRSSPSDAGRRRASLPRRPSAGSETTAPGDITVSGHRVTDRHHGNRPQATTTQNHPSNQHTGSLPQPTNQPPSIPLPYSAESLQVNTTVTRKPPSGGHGNGRRQGRLRSQPLYRDSPATRGHNRDSPGTRGRSNSRERARSGEPGSQSPSSLFIGHDPTSIPGFNCDFLLSNQPSRSSTSKRNDQSQAAKVDQSAARDGVSDISLTGVRLEER